MSYRYWLCFLTYFLSLPSLAGGFKAYTQIVGFGDSTTDTGNACPKDGKDQAMILCPLYRSSGFSDGTIWIEHLAKRMRLELKPSRENGFNFAFGGATRGWGTEIPGLRRQVHTYLEKVEDRANPDALYAIWIGGNDFKNEFMGLSFLRDPRNLLFQELLDDICHAVIRLSRKGARHFLIPNLPPVHQTPLAEGALKGFSRAISGLSFLLTGNSQTLDFVSYFQTSLETVIRLYNAQLDLRLRALKADLLEKKGLDVQIHHPDVFGMFKDAEANFKAYGLRHPDELFCFDHFHPSAKAHALLDYKFAHILGWGRFLEART